MNWYLMALKKYAEFNGRSRRKEYWMFVLFFLIFYIIVVTLDVFLQLGVLTMIYLLASIVPLFAVNARRMHDAGKSGWFMLIPIYSLILACTNGDVGENKYGPDPKNDNAFGNEALDSHLTR